jgi:K+ transporter
MLIWFVVIGILGIVGIAKGPAILAALSPLPAITYLWHAGPLALVVIGGAFLAVTGGEAFYADMGHFGPFPIRVAWFAVALPTLTLNYFGQGGLLLTQPGAIENSFYQLAPEWSHYGLVTLATVATVIASQSIISGAYSLTSQAIQLGFLPRMQVIHTARQAIGQIYVPAVNWLLAFGTLTAVIGFGSSAALAGAFGIAVSLLMAITTLMATFVALSWKTNPLIVYAVNGSLLALDLLVRRIDLDQAAGRRLVPLGDLIHRRVPHAHLAQGPGDHGSGALAAARGIERIRRTYPRPIRPFKFRVPQSCSAASSGACRSLSPATSSSTTCCTNGCCSSRWC